MYSCVGIAGLAFLFWAQSPPELLPWAAFAAFAVYLEWNTVEVDDRLMASAGMMVQITAGVALGAGNAALTMCGIAVLGTFTRDDIVQRRLFQPAVNFGIIVVTAMASGLVLDLFAYAPDRTQNLTRFAVIAALAGVVASIFNSAQVTLVVRAAYGRSGLRPWASARTLIPLYAAMGATGGLLGGTYLIVGAEVLPLIVVMILVANFMFRSRAAVRVAHESTIRGFIKALEARDLYARGHTERVAMFCRLVAEDFGLGARRMQNLRWAALVHDVGTLAVPRDLLRDRAGLTDEEEAQIAVNIKEVHDLLASVEFLDGAMDIVALLDAPAAQLPSSEAATDAQILTVAKRFDQLTNRPGRETSLTQSAAFTELRSAGPTVVDPIVVAALERAIGRTGVTYGAIEVDPTITRETYARQAMYER